MTPSPIDTCTCELYGGCDMCAPPAHLTHVDSCDSCGADVGSGCDLCGDRDAGPGILECLGEKHACTWCTFEHHAMYEI